MNETFTYYKMTFGPEGRKSVPVTLTGAEAIAKRAQMEADQARQTGASKKINSAISCNDVAALLQIAR